MTQEVGLHPHQKYEFELYNILHILYVITSSMALLLAWGGVVVVVNDCLPVTLTIINCTSSSTVWSLSGSFKCMTRGMRVVRGRYNRELRDTRCVHGMMIIV